MSNVMIIHVSIWSCLWMIELPSAIHKDVHIIILIFFKKFVSWVQANFWGIHESSKVTGTCYSFIELQINMGVHCGTNHWCCCRCLGIQFDTPPRTRSWQAAVQVLQELPALRLLPKTCQRIFDWQYLKLLQSLISIMLRRW